VDHKVPIDLGVGILKGQPNELQVSTAEQFSDAVSNAVQNHVRISRVHQIVLMTRMDGAPVGRQSIPRAAKTKYAAREEERRGTELLKSNKTCFYVCSPRIQ
jgi:hypothetical protein